MLNRKQTKAIKKFIYTIFKQFWQLSRSTSRKLSRWLVRNLLNIGRRRRMATARSGFVLPTVVMLLLVIALVVAALLFRTGSRTNQVIGAREEQVIYNAATPAIERAKAKLEYLFLKDKRFPSGPPSDEMLLSMLTNRPDQYSGSGPPLTYPLTPTNPYKLNDEIELPDINGDGKTDPAWFYEIDVDGDGNKETVVYSIALKRRETVRGVSVTLENSKDQDKADGLVVRNGPINSRTTTNPVCSALTAAPAPPAGGAAAVRATNEDDWFPQGTATLRKTFQVDAIVISNKAGTSRTVATLEFQQDRQLDRGNKWGAWFRYDLEIFPGFPFQWNGAMYTAGNLMIGNGANFTGYLISAKDSCFYTKPASEIKINRNIPSTPTPLNPRFVGQIVAGQVEGNAFNGSSSLHVMKDDFSPNTNANDTKLNSGTDSVKDGAPNSTVTDIALDPVILFTRGVSQSRGTDLTNETTNDGRFDGEGEAGQIGYLSGEQRIARNTESPPFIDDTYRADDRYGPKSSYGRNNEVVLDGSSKKNGTNITETGDLKLLSNNTVDPLDTEFRSLGWDGYWERRAYKAGLRLIVGERLELGNPFGWVWNQTAPNTYKNDPLYPSDQVMPHAERQRRTLRDNLAAVQATAVYHVANPSGGADVPVTCLATTSHPGTQATIDLSKDFRKTNGQLSTNFFTGKGTNGWEYETPPTGLGGNWDTALRNLASFAGEINGAFPPLQKAGEIHPNPFLTMWGNFSNLRRAMESGNSSIADNSYKYTAACTMGMLAQNIYDIQTSTISTGDVQDLSDALPTTLTATATASDYIAAMSSNATRQERLRLIHLQNQIKRDREFGFALVPQTILDDANHSYSVQYFSSATPPLPGGTETPYTFAGITYDKNVATETATTKKTLKLSCNYKEAAPNGKDYFGLGAPINATEEKRFIRLAVSLCSSTQVPELPSLYYLFPTATHGRNSVDGTVNSNEPYISQTSVIGGNFTALDPISIKLAPRDVGAWKLPHTTDGTGRTKVTQITKPDNGQEYVALIDTGFYNGREMMTVRTLDVDLDLLRKNSINGDTWIPKTGIVYAFREDGAREDAIARPGAGPGSCSTNADIITSGCQMRANPNNPQDPAVTDKFISPKPVDYYPDPDRRVHGFRLRNGKDISRAGNKGLSFISDNPVYIQGDFNLHSTDGNTNNLEEFTQQLDPSNWAGTFYNRTTLDNRFARPETDHWRPSEILGDAITILSNNFQEGSLELGITNNTATRNSFLAMNGPSAARTWVREDGTTSNMTLPIKVSRNGKPLYCVDAACTNLTEETSFRPLDTNYWGSINAASPTRVNAMIVSGITPSGQGLSYGGIQNFPRYIENWQTVDQFISGSFLQLNFSTYATAPFRQNAWEPGTTSGSGFPQYYIAPNRRWGYDVGLQYAPAGPVAQRFVQPPASRSEFYKDLRADDVYICKLRRAMNTVRPTLDQASLTECN